MKKRILLSMLVSIAFFAAIINAKLAIRERGAHCQVGRCFSGQGYNHLSSTADAEAEVNRLRQEAIKAYDTGTYMTGMNGWAEKRQRALDIQTKLGYTVPQNYEWGD